MAAPKSQTMRQSLHIRIDPSPYDPEVVISPESASPSPSSGWTSAGDRSTPTSGGSDQEEFSVLCMHDFRAADIDQLGFRKNEILVIVKRENTGWWAAMRKGGDVIGWIPQAFVNPLTEEMAKRLANVREELRIYEYSAEQLYSAPISRNEYIFDSEPEPESTPRRRVSPQHLRSPERNAHDQRRRHTFRAGSNQISGLVDTQSHKIQKCTPPSPTTPMPQPPSRLNAGINKPTPPIPNEKDDIGVQESSRNKRSPSNRRRPTMDTINIRGHTSPEPTGVLRPRTADRPRRPLPVEDYSQQPILVLKASVPRYLKPRFVDQLELDADDQVRRGPIPALVERLIATNIENNQYQAAFLMTFRSFISPDKLFDALTEYYNLPQPDDLNAAELEDWLERGQAKTQRKVLELFSDWLQLNHLLEEEPHIARRLTEFLQSIEAGPNGKVSKLIQERIKDLTFSIGSPITVSPLSASRKKKPFKLHKLELLKIEAGDVAEQLTITIYDIYRKILPQECIIYAKAQKGPGVTNLREFCAFHDKTSCWVQMSILTIETMKKRAETVDHWIKVAEKCRALNNIASMSAIITALNSTVIARLPLTWAHVSKRSILDSLSRCNDPSGQFATYRALNNVDGPCLPFVTMYLTDMAHIQDQYTDKESQICFYKRKRFYDVISIMLRHQKKEPYAISQWEEVATFIRNQLQDPPDNRWFWKKSEEVQQSELAHADIRRGLEKAGF